MPQKTNVTREGWQSMSGMQGGEDLRVKRGYEERPTLIGQGDEEDSTPNGQLGKSLERLEKSISVLKEELGILYDRITPVQQEEIEKSDGDMKIAGMVSQPRGEIVRIVDDVTSRVNAMARRCTDERSRLEL